MKEERLHNFLVAIICLPTSGSSEIKGSGVLISKDLVLTCAHNFYYGTELAEKNKVKVYVAPCGE